MDKVICVGKNYLKHAVELGDAVNEEALLFIKPPSTCTLGEGAIDIPKTGEIHHEVELVLEIRGGRFTRYTIGLDLTIRDLQTKLKKAGHPWEKGKVFKNSSILGPWREIRNLDELLAQPFSIKVNGEVRQKGLGQDMRWKPEDLLKEAGKWFPICDGDLLFTGTPEGVAELKAGDQVEVSGPDLNYRFQVRR